MEKKNKHFLDLVQNHEFYFGNFKIKCFALHARLKGKNLVTVRL